MEWAALWLIALIATGQEEKSPAPPGAELSRQQAQSIRIGDRTAELEVEPDVLRLHIHDTEGGATDFRPVRGMVVIGPCADGKTYRYGLFPETISDGDIHSLRADVDLSDRSGTTLPIRFILRGLNGKGDPQVPISVATDLRIEFSDEKLAMIRQAVCPVTRMPLESMGEPHSAEIDGQLVFVCCEPCIDIIKQDSRKYLSTVKTTSLKPSPASEKDRPAIENQKLCPVSKQPLGSMGNPWKVPLKGKMVFVCCKHCIESLLETSNAE